MENPIKKLLIILAIFAISCISTMIATYSIANWPERKYQRPYTHPVEMVTRTDIEMVFNGTLCVFGVIIALMIFFFVLKELLNNWKS